MQFHDLADIFPLLEGAEFEVLKADIRANGLLEPIWLHGGQILDGRNRYRACLAVGVEPRYRYWAGDGSPQAAVISLNLHRRHLDESQRAMVAARIANMQQGARNDLVRICIKSQGEQRGPGGFQAVSQSAAADLLNVSLRSVASAAKVSDNGATELIAAVTQGKVAVSTAAELAELPKAVQAALVAKGERYILQAAKEIQQRKAQDKRLRESGRRAQLVAESTASVSPDVDVRCGDVLDLMRQLPDAVIDVIATDAPYDIGSHGGFTRLGSGNAGESFNPGTWDCLPPGVYDDLMQQFLVECRRILKPHGAIWMFVDRWRVTDFKRWAESASLQALGEVTWIKPNIGPNPRRVPSSDHEVCLYLACGPERLWNADKGRWRGSIEIPLVGGSDRTLWPHTCSKPVEFFLAYLPLSLEAGMTVCDPFSGSGSVGEAAARLGCRFIGFDADPECVAMTQRRVEEVWKREKRSA